METSGDRLTGGIGLAGLVPLFEQEGPVASVHLTLEPDVEDASQRSLARWKPLRRDLDAAGAPEDLLDRLEAVIAGAHHGGRGVVVVASSTGSPTVEHGASPPPADGAAWGPLPSVLPLVAWRQAEPTVVVVLADRQGADLRVLRRAAGDLERTVRGDDFPLSKVGPGGWSQPRYQRRAEGTWASNARQVADEVDRLATAVGARLVVAAGDERALGLLRDELDQETAARLVTVDGGRAAGAGGADEDEAAFLVAEAVAADTAAVLDAFRRELGEADRAAEGVGGVVRALSESRVEVLLLAEGLATGSGRTLWSGPAPTALATTVEDLQGLGVEEPVEAPLVDVLLRAAALTGATARLVPEADAPRDGVGAVLRWG